MKRLTVALLLGLLTAIAGGLTIPLEVTVPPGKVNVVKEGFLAEMPVPLDPNGNPLYPDNTWIRTCIERNAKNFIRTTVHRGWMKLEQQRRIADANGMVE